MATVVLIPFVLWIVRLNYSDRRGRKFFGALPEAERARLDEESRAWQQTYGM